MKAYQVEAAWGLKHLGCVAVESPKPGPGEVAVRIEAVALNYRDILVVEGKYNPRFPRPLTPCSDAAGVVEEVGPGVTRFEIGQRVVPIFAQRWWSGEPSAEKLNSTMGGPLQGTLRERIVVSEEGLVEVPNELSSVEAACFPCAGLTAWSALVSYGAVTAGETVLMLGTGGVSIFALQLCGFLGAQAIVTSSSNEKLRRAQEMGAAKVINYIEEPQWGKVVREMTGGRGVDLVVEVGGAATLPQSIRAVRSGGQIALIGVLGGAINDLNMLPVLMRNIRIQGILVGHRERLEALLRAAALHRWRPAVDRVFSFEEAPQAFEYLASGAHFGKVAIEVQS